MGRRGRVALILVTDPRWDDAHIIAVAGAACVLGDAFAVQLRDRTGRTDEELLPLATSLRDITARAGAGLVINRRLSLARAVGADGFHAPPGDLMAARDLARSAPAHDDVELRQAMDAGATAAFVSPIFDVPGKHAARGLGALRSARRIAPNLTLVALGGVGEANARACLDAGADAVAVMRALLDARDPARVAKCLVPSTA